MDIDNTLYRHEEYSRAASRWELEEIALVLRMDVENTQEVIKRTRNSVAEQSNGPVTLTEVVYELGISFEAWSELRNRAWRPESWLERDEDLSALLLEAAPKVGVSIAFGTNSPLEVGKRTLHALGIGEAYPVFGPESFMVSKPNVRFFVSIAKEIGITPSQCVSIGDRRFSDADPALVAGFGSAVVVTGRDELIDVLRVLLKEVVRL